MDSRIKSGKVIRVGNENILHTTVPQAVEHGRPELGALIFAYPHASTSSGHPVSRRSLTVSMVWL